MKKSYQEPSLVLAQIESHITILAGSPTNLNVDPYPIPDDGQGS